VTAEAATALRQPPLSKAHAIVTPTGIPEYPMARQLPP
jgi:hypothetical protein